MIAKSGDQVFNGKAGVAVKFEIHHKAISMGGGGGGGGGALLKGGHLLKGGGGGGPFFLDRTYQATLCFT